MTTQPEAAEVLWTPGEGATGCALADFARFARAQRGAPLPNDADYPALQAWSVDDLAGFWSAAADHLGVRFHSPPSTILEHPGMPGTRWFPGATLNYAEHALRPGPGKQDDDLAVVCARESGAADGPARRVTFGELRDLVARARQGLLAAGVQRGDRVAAFTPNVLETLATFLAAAGLGAVWSSCSPDFGARAVRDRFAQIEPVVLLATSSYVYGGRRFDVSGTLAELCGALGSLRAVVLLDDDAATASPTSGARTVTWSQFVAEPAVLAFEPVPFDHPLWVLYSSGTTGLPKAIVQGHGGIVLEHLKALRLQLDLRPGERFCWFTTTGWMMWNFLVGGLLAGCPVVLYDGNPGYPDLGALWRLAGAQKIGVLGVSAPFLQACRRAGVVPRELADLSALRAVGSTGAPLPPEGFDWVRDTVGVDVQLCSISGGTDICTALVGAAPTVPVWRGELSCAQLGVAVEVFDETGRPVQDAVGELVVTAPMPSMPVAFWNDPDGARLRAAYFEDFPGVWRHGDWVRRTPRGSYVIYGRSDSTLNRGGVRMGTADFYAVAETVPEVVDCLVVDTSGLDGSGPDGSGPDGGGPDAGRRARGLWCFLVLAPGATLEDVEPRLREALRRELSPRHVPDRFVVVPAVPRTLTGKKCEVPVKRILAGVAPEIAVSREALADPDSLAPFVALAHG